MWLDKHMYVNAVRHSDMMTIASSIESFGRYHAGSFFSSRALNPCAKANAALRGNNENADNFRRTLS